MNPKMLALCTVALGCADLAPPAEPSTAVFAQPREGMETNTPYLLGEDLDPLGDSTYHLSVPTAATDRVGRKVAVQVTAGGSLTGVDHVGVTHVGADPWFGGLQFTPAPASVMIVTARQNGALTVYSIRHRASAAAPWTDPCGGADAVVHTGRWLRDGRHEVAGTSLTFACTTAAAGECSLWGYLPGADPASTGWAANEACTRMLRADRCRTGTSTTIAGTRIKFYDRVNVNTQPPHALPPVTSWPPPHNEFYFDGAWSRDGMVCGGKPRWQSLAIGGDCPTILPDPRITATAEFCDETALPDGPEILFISTSVYNQVGLHRWVRGNDHVVTVRGFYSGTATVQPFPLAYAHEAFEGMLMRDIPESLDPNDLLEVNMYLGPSGDRVVTTAARAPSGYVNEGTEGYVFANMQPGTVPLREYSNGTDRITTTQTPAAGYTLHGTVGWVSPL